MRVLMAPDWRQKNPYLELLAAGLRHHGVTVLFPPGYRRGLPLWRTVRSMPGLDILHLHWQEAYAHSRRRLGLLFDGLRLWLDLRLVKASGCRIVWTLHNELPHDTPFPAVERWIQRLVAQAAEAVIVHSEAALPVLRAVAPQAVPKVCVIPHGGYQGYYGPAVPQGEARRRLGLPERGRLFLYFGRLCPYKGVDLLLDAWQMTEADGRDIQLVIVGEPESPDYGHRIASLAQGLSRITLCTEFVPDEDVRFYFSAADFAVFPFRRILTSGSLTLAKSYRVPVIVPDCPAIRMEIPEEVGYFFTPGDAASLSAALRRAADNPPGRAVTKEPLPSWEEMAGATAAVYRKALNGSSFAPNVHAASTRA